jgi:diguanylate cyclase (GGDEF)-like protein/PAS domain S-box-containing protein
MINRIQKDARGREALGGGSSVAAPQRTARRTGSRGVSPAAAAAALDVVSDAVLFLNAELRVADANAAAARGSGYRRSQLRGMHLREVLDGDFRLLASLNRSQCRDLAADSLPACWRRKDGSSLPVQLHLRFVDRQGERLLVAVLRDAGDARDLAARTPGAESRDFLTGLSTREELERRLRRAESPFAVLFIDLDRFKNVNDAHGHRIGDLVLRTVGRRLSACMRPLDFVARYGGDEFVALIENVRAENGVERIAKRIRAELRAPIAVGGRQLRLSASVGVAIGEPFSSAQAIVDEADRAMYREKCANHQPATLRPASS